MSPADRAIERRSSLWRSLSVCASSSAVRAATRLSSSALSRSSWRVLRYSSTNTRTLARSTSGTTGTAT